MKKTDFKEGDVIRRISQKHQEMKLGDIAIITKIISMTVCELDRYHGKHALCFLEKYPAGDTPLWRLLNE